MNTREILDQLKPIERELSIAKGLTISAASAYSLLSGLIERLEAQQEEERDRDGNSDGPIAPDALRTYGDECDRLGCIGNRDARLAAGGYLRRAAETIDFWKRGVATAAERAERAEQAAAEAPQLAAGDADRLRKQLEETKAELDLAKANPLKQLIDSFPRCQLTLHYPGKSN